MKRLLVAAMFLVGGAALASDAVDRLADQARFLESRSQLEQAVSAWQRVLRARPEHPEALSRLSVISARRSQSARTMPIAGSSVHLQQAPSPLAPGKAM